MSIDTRATEASAELRASFAGLEAPPANRVHRKRRRRTATRGVAALAAVVVMLGAIVVATRPAKAPVARPRIVRPVPQPASIIATDTRGSIVELDLDGRRVRELVHADTPRDVNERPIGARLADGRVVTYDASTVKILSGSGHPAIAVRGAVSPEGRHSFAMVSSPGGGNVDALDIFDIGTYARRHVVLRDKTNFYNVDLVSWSPDGSRIRMLRAYEVPGGLDVRWIEVDPTSGAVVVDRDVPDNVWGIATDMLGDDRLLELNHGPPYGQPPVNVWTLDATDPSTGKTQALAVIPPALAAPDGGHGAQVTVDASGQHILVFGDGGVYFVNVGGSSGWITHNPYYWAAW